MVIWRCDLLRIVARMCCSRLIMFLLLECIIAVQTIIPIVASVGIYRLDRHVLPFYHQSLSLSLLHACGCNSNCFRIIAYLYSLYIRKPCAHLPGEREVITGNWMNPNSKYGTGRIQWGLGQYNSQYKYAGEWVQSINCNHICVDQISLLAGWGKYHG